MSRFGLQTENLVLRHQINILRRATPRRLRPAIVERLLFRLALSAMAGRPTLNHDSEARDGRSLASSGLASVLALEIPWNARASEDR
jgi:hypothetical protein